MAMEIDQIFEMLSWDNDKETQLRGIEEAKQIKHLSVFLQPIESKLIWENCARVLISKNDKELQLYLVSMFKWLQDMNWPGADYIYDRLKNMPKEIIEIPYHICLTMAKETQDYSWEAVLKKFMNEIL